MASVEDCERAFHDLADRLASADPEHKRRADFDRTLSCTILDLDVIFGGRLDHGELTDIRRLEADPKAQVRMTMSSDDLIGMVKGELNMGAAWATGRVKIDAGVRDLLRLRSIF